MKLHVSNFVYTTTESELVELFSQQGSVVNVRIVYDQFTRQSKCFGYVQMANNDEAKRAIDSLNGKKFNDQPLVVQRARRV